MQACENDHSIIWLSNVHKHYSTKKALLNINLDISHNEFLFITGPSGAGKTTLLKLLFLGEPASEGQIIIDGVNLMRISRRRIPFLRRKFGIIFQDYKLIPTKTVFENIAMVAEAVGTRRRLISKKIKSLLRTVGLEDKLNALPPTLSGGEQQRVAVARAVVGDPKIIVADEPTASLDPESADVILNLLRRFHALGTTVIIATHDTELIRRTGGRVILLEDGQVQVSTMVPKSSD